MTLKCPYCYNHMHELSLSLTTMADCSCDFSVHHCLNKQCPVYPLSTITSNNSENSLQVSFTIDKYFIVVYNSETPNMDIVDISSTQSKVINIKLHKDFNPFDDKYISDLNALKIKIRSYIYLS